MFTYHTRRLLQSEVDEWLNSFSKKGLALKIVGYAVGPADGRLIVTIMAWNRTLQMTSAASGRSTIDDIPQEPSIEYPEPNDV